MSDRLKHIFPLLGKFLKVYEFNSEFPGIFVNIPFPESETVVVIVIVSSHCHRQYRISPLLLTTMVLELVGLLINDILIVVELLGKPVTGEKTIVELEPETGLSNWTLEDRTIRETIVPAA